jgi:hypothetical protein
VPAVPRVPAAPPMVGFLSLLTACLLLRVFSERPDPVPKLLP